LKVFAQKFERIAVRCHEKGFFNRLLTAASVFRSAGCRNLNILYSVCAPPAFAAAAQGAHH
jgi:hypothetical protein